MSSRARSEDAILRATIELVAEHGVGGLTVDAVAARAGVGKQTIYRHWGSRARLVHDAIACIHEKSEPPDTGSVREDIRLVLLDLVAFLSREDTGRVLPSLIDAAERDRELADLHEEHVRQRRAMFARILERGIERGELRRDVDVGLLTDLLVGPFFYRRVLGRRAVERSQVEPVLDLVLGAVGAPDRART